MFYCDPSLLPQGRRNMELEVAKNAEKDKFDFSSDPLHFTTSADTILPLTLTRIPRDFTITTDGYISLCSRVYAACSSSSPGFARDISESAFQYCAIICLWKRFAQILSKAEKNGSEFFTELAHLEYPILLPIPLVTYLQGIGHFRDPDSCDRRFRLPVFPTDKTIGGIPYTFGRVNAETHAFYEALPAPGIAALRMQADIRYTEDDCENNFLWDLPEELRPDIQETQVESVRPTKNLLGWAPAQRLTDSQMKLFAMCKMADDDGAPYTSVRGLVAEINRYLTNWQSCEFGLQCAGSTGHPLIGSLVQGMSIEKHYDFCKFDRSAMYCEGNISVCSPYKSNDTLNKGAVISGYRMAKEPIDARHCWSCYDFNEYKSVPESWIRSRNFIYTYGNTARLNETIYSTGHICKRVLQNECIQHTMFEASENWNALD